MCIFSAMVLPTQTNAPTDSGIVSTRTDPPLIIETTPSLMTESNPTASIGGSTSSSGNNGGNGNTSTGDGGNGK